MKKPKKLTVILLTAFFLISALSLNCSIYADNTASDININCKLLDSVMQDRPWVIDTLLENNWEGNPYAEALAFSKGPRESVMENYTESLAFKTVIDIMELYANKGQYIEGLTNDVLNDLIDKLGVETESDVYRMVNAYTSDLDSLKYESIFNDMLIQNYESSWGVTLADENMDYEILKQRSKVYKNLGAYQKALRDYLGLTNMYSEIIVYDPLKQASADYTVSIEKYTGHFMDAYRKDLKNYLDGVVAIPGLEGKSALQEKIITSGALAGITAYEKAVASSGVETEIETIFREYMCKDTMKILGAAGKLLNIGSYSVDNAILMEALVSQKESTVNTMNRLSAYTEDTSLSGTLNHYENLLEEEGNKKIISYEGLASYIRQNNEVNNIIGSIAGKSISKIYDSYSFNYNGMSDYVWVENIARAMAVVKLSAWLGEETTGFQTAAKEVYVCKYIDKIIAETVELTKRDIEKYKAGKTEQNAENVINDLELLKKLRLYSQKSGYESIMGNMNSWIGALLSNDEDIESIKTMYQKSIDVILGCTVVAAGDKPLEIKDNQRCIVYKYNKNGTMIGSISAQNSSTPDYMIPEFENYITGGIKISNGELNISQELSDCYIPYIDVSGVTNINIAATNIAFGDIKNSGTLNINLTSENASFEIINKLINTGSFNVNGKPNGTATQTCYIIENTASINIKNTGLDVNGNVANSGSINGRICICGDGTQKYKSACFKYGRQNVMGTGTVTSLALEGSSSKDIKIDGVQTITGNLSGGELNIINSKNLVVTGECIIENGYFNSDLTFKNYTASAYTKIKGIGYLKGNVKFNAGVEFGEGIDIACNKLELNGDCIARDDIKYSSGDISGLGWLEAHGGLYITNGNPHISKLCFAGKIPQNITSSSAVNVGQLKNLNTSAEGVYFGGTINVKESIYHGSSSNYNNGKNIVLKGNAVIGNSDFVGNISANSWVCGGTQSIKGSLYTSGSIQIASNAALDVSEYNQSGGTLEIDKDGVLKCSSNYINNGTVTSKGLISVSNDSKITGAHTGGTFITQGNIDAMAVFKPEILKFTGKLVQTFYNSKTSETKELYIENSSKQGIIFTSALNVTGKVKQKPDAAYSGDKNIILKGSAVITGTSLAGGIAVSDWTCSSNMTVGGVLYASDNITVDDSVKLQVGEYRQNSGTLEIGKDSALECSGNYINGAAVTNKGLISVSNDSKITGTHTGGTFAAKGNVDIAAEFKPDILRFESRLSQTFTSSSAVNVGQLKNLNTSAEGIYFGGTINIKKSIYHGSSSNYNKGKNIFLRGDAVIENSDFTGNISADGWVCSGTQSIKGSLYTSGSIQIGNNAALDVSEYNQSGGTLEIGKDGELQCSENYINSGTVTSEGLISVSDDSKITGAHTGGTFTAKGNMDISAEFKPDILRFESRLSQSFYNSAVTETDQLYINNKSAKGFFANSLITVKSKFDNKCKNLKNAGNIRIKSDAINKNILNHDVCVDSEFKVSAGEHIYINGNLVLKSGARITIENGGELIVKKHVNSQSSVLDINSGGRMQINDCINSSSDIFNIGGELLIKGDAQMKNSSVSGDGLITFRGDLNVSSGTWNKPNVSFDSKLYQAVSGSQINVNNLTISNSARAGISLSSVINCYGNLEQSYLKISGGSYIVKK